MGIKNLFNTSSKTLPNHLKPWLPHCAYSKYRTFRVYIQPSCSYYILLTLQHILVENDNFNYTKKMKKKTKGKILSFLIRKIPTTLIGLKYANFILKYELFLENNCCSQSNKETKIPKCLTWTPQWGLQNESRNFCKPHCEVSHIFPSTGCRGVPHTKQESKHLLGTGIWAIWRHTYTLPPSHQLCCFIKCSLIAKTSECGRKEGVCDGVNGRPRKSVLTIRRQLKNIPILFFPH